MGSFVPASHRRPCNISLKYSGSLSCYLISATNFSLNNAGLKTKMQVHGLIFLFPSVSVWFVSFFFIFLVLLISVVLYSLFSCLSSSYHSLLRLLVNRVLSKAFGSPRGKKLDSFWVKFHNEELSDQFLLPPLFG